MTKSLINISKFKESDYQMFLFSETNDEKLKENLSKILNQDFESNLYDLSLALFKNFSKDEKKIIIISDSYQDLSTKIENTVLFLNGEKDSLDKGVFASKDIKGKLAILFSGQGSQYTGMLKELAEYFPIIDETISSASSILEEKFKVRFSKTLAELIYPESCDNKESQKKAEAELTSTDVTQPALGAVEVALLKLVEGLNIKADMFAGHSYGEFVALFAANKFSFEDLMLISEARGRLIVDKAKEDGQELGSMAAIRANREAVEEVIKDVNDVVIANHNAYEQIIISGSEQSIIDACAKFKEVKIKSIKLPVAAAFHSKFVEPAQKDFVKIIENVSWQQGSNAAIYSNNSAKPHSDNNDDIVKSMSAHLTGPVEFVEQINNMYDDGARIFLEVGPKNVLTKLTQNILKGKDFSAIAIDDNGKSIKGLLFAIAELLTMNIDLDIEKIYN